MSHHSRINTHSFAIYHALALHCQSASRAHIPQPPNILEHAIDPIQSIAASQTQLRSTSAASPDPTTSQKYLIVSSDRLIDTIGLAQQIPSGVQFLGLSELLGTAGRGPSLAPFTPLAVGDVPVSPSSTDASTKGTWCATAPILVHGLELGGFSSRVMCRRRCQARVSRDMLSWTFAQ